MTILFLLPLAIGTSATALAQGVEWKKLNDEATSLFGQGRNDLAMVAAKKALQVAEQTDGPNHPDVATSLENMAQLCRKTARKTAAEELEKRAAAIRATKR